MRQLRITSAKRLIALAAIPLAMTLGAGVVGAQQRYPSQQQQQRQYRSQQELFEWSGRVDSEIRIQVNRNNASVMQAGRNERTSGRVRSMNALPPQDGTVTVQVLEGRGQVDVIQQPNSRNGYTAVVRVRDPQGGVSRYRLAAYWTPNGNFGGRRRGNR
jgi:hypothetical protein